MRPLQTATAVRLLQNNAFDIEFHGYLSNHAKHAIIALDRIGAPESRIEEYWDTYTTLTPYSLSLHPVNKPWDDVIAVSRTEYNSLRGKKLKWQEQVAFLQNELNDDNIKQLVRKHAPELLSGIAGALTHGIIHLGWAIDAESPWMVMEGLAYLNFCHLGVETELLTRGEHPSDSSALESYIRVTETFYNSDLASRWAKEAKLAFDESFHPELVPAGFQWEAAKVMCNAHPVATEIPVWIDSKSIEAIFEDLYRAMVVLYLSSRDDNGNGSFLLLHLITSLWGLEQTCLVIDDDHVTRNALAQFYSMSICLMATSSFPSVQSLLQVLRDEPESKLQVEPDWSAIMQRGMAEIEEHNIKLVYVCQELWKRYGKWNGFVEAATSFTLTPNIGPKQSTYSIDSLPQHTTHQQ